MGWEHEDRIYLVQNRDKSGGLLWIRWRTFGFHKMQSISWLVEDLLASQEELCFMDLIHGVAWVADNVIT
jgi:hypothetical protein